MIKVTLSNKQALLVKKQAKIRGFKNSGDYLVYLIMRDQNSSIKSNKKPKPKFLLSELTKLAESSKAKGGRHLSRDYKKILYTQ